ncbi:hypothetical protein [Nocardia coubleae]|nr:hypothetical protein [Nocardia coubleae]
MLDPMVMGGRPLAAVLDNQTGQPGGALDPTMATILFPGSTIEQRPTLADGVPAMQTRLQTPGLPDTTVTKSLIGSATLTTALTSVPESSSGPEGATGGYDGMPSGTGILASGPENLALRQGPPLSTTGALVTGATAVGTGAALSTLAFTETGLLITAGTFAAVISWPVVLAVGVGAAATAGTIWLLSQDPPEGEEPSKGAQPGSVPTPPPAPPLPASTPAPHLPPVIPEITAIPVPSEEAILGPPFPSTELPEITGPVVDPTERVTPWEPHVPPALDPFDTESDGVDDPTALPDPTQTSPKPLQPEPVAPATQIPASAADQTTAGPVTESPTAQDPGLDSAKVDEEVEPEDAPDWRWIIDSEGTVSQERYAPAGRELPLTGRFGDGSERYPVRDFDKEGDVIVQTTGLVDHRRAWELFHALFPYTSIFVPAPDMKSNYVKIDEYIAELFAFVDFKAFWKIEPDAVTGGPKDEFKKRFILDADAKGFRKKFDLTMDVMGPGYSAIIVTENELVRQAYEEEFYFEISNGQFAIMSAAEYKAALESVGVQHPNHDATFGEFLERNGWV